jgi:hypothetical protein
VQVLIAIRRDAMLLNAAASFPTTSCDAVFTLCEKSPDAILSDTSRNSVSGFCSRPEIIHAARRITKISMISMKISQRRVDETSLYAFSSE